MTNEVAKATAASVPQTTGLLESGFSNDDILIPRLLLMQNTSAYVGDEKAKLGDILDSLSLERLAGFADVIEIVPLHVFKTWRVYNVSDEFKAGGGKLMRVEPFTAGNADQEWEGKEADPSGKLVPVKRVASYNAYALLKRDLESGASFPVNIIFKVTSAQAGKQLVSLIYRQEIIGQPMYGKAVTLGAAKQKKDTNTYAVFEVKPGTPVDPKYFEQVRKWQNIVRSAAVRVDEKDDGETQAPAKAPAVVITESPENSPY